MLEVVRTRVRSLTLDNYVVSWEIQDTAEDVADYTFEVQRSEAQAGPWDTLSKPFRDRYRFTDTQMPAANPHRTFFYRLRIVHVPTGAESFSVPADAQPEADLITLEARRHMGLLLREFAGRRCWVYQRRTFGFRCPSCFSKILSKVTSSGCLTCYSTGYVRGYTAPIETWIQIDPGQNATKQSLNIGAIAQNNTTARLVDVDGLKPQDVIIEPENRRWRVISVGQTEHVRSPVHFELVLHEIPKGDIEYDIPVPLADDLQDLALSPARNYTNPQNLENFQDEEIPSILSLYPYPTKPPRS